MRTALARFRAMTHEQRARVLRALPEDERLELLEGLELIQKSLEQNLIKQMYPEHGAHRRELYPKQMELYELGASYQFRAFLGGNGTGKTLGAGIELVYHLTGEYPSWWRGWRFDGPIRAMAAGDTKETVRDIIQAKMLGADGELGTGLIPASAILKVVYRQNGNGAVDFVVVRHKNGRKHSRLYFKSFDQGRKTFQGRELDFIWLDEECPLDVFQECVHRFRGATKDGRLLLTFTPLNGVTDVVKLFVPQFSNRDEDDEPESVLLADSMASRTFVLCSWDDIPHMSDEERERKLANTMPYEQEARQRGIPTSGRGRVFTVEEDSFVVSPFRIPAHWPRLYGADFGFGKVKDVSGTGVVWGAWDQATDTLYIYDEYLRAEQPPSMHAAAIKSRGEWIKGVGDYAGSNLEGEKTLDIYRQLKLDIVPANKEVYAGLMLITQFLNEGRLRVFNTCQKWLAEYRLYSLDENNRVIKKRDHLMDATRYLLMADRKRATVQPIPKGRRTAPPPSDPFGFYGGN